MDFSTLIPFELRNICKPLPIRLWCMEITIEYVIGHILRMRSVTGTTVAAVLNGRLDLLYAADPQNALVTHVNAKVVFQVIPDTAIALVWMLPMYLLYLLCNL